MPFNLRPFSPQYILVLNSPQKFTGPVGCVRYEAHRSCAEPRRRVCLESVEGFGDLFRMGFLRPLDFDGTKLRFIAPMKEYATDQFAVLDTCPAAP
jgi:hypothetical protein